MQKYGLLTLVLLATSIVWLFNSTQALSDQDSSGTEDCSSELAIIPKESKRLYNLGDVAYIKGTWKGNNTEQAFVIQTSYIECWRKNLECMEATAYIDPTGFPGGWLGLDIDYYTIVSWNDRELVAINDQAKCVTYKINVIFDGKTAFKTRTIKQSASPACKAIVELTQWQLELVDGIKFGLEYYGRKRKTLKNTQSR